MDPFLRLAVAGLLGGGVRAVPERLGGHRLERAPAARRPARGAAVPDRLRRRVLALARQRGRDRADLQLLPRAAGLPAPRPLLGRARGAGLPRDHDRPGRGPARALRLGLVPVRRAPDRLGGAAPHGGRGEHRSREEPRLPLDPQAHAGPRRLRRAQVLRREGGQALCDAPLRGADVRGVLGRDVRGGLDPRDLRRHQPPVPGVQLERVRGAGPAACTSRSRR